jgi:TonB family protein
MNTEVNQQIWFGSEINPPLGWRSYATSMVVHIAVVVILLLIPVAVTREIRKSQEIVTLIAPQLKPYKPATPKIQPPKLLAKSVIIPKPTPQFKAPVLPPKPAIAAPQIDPPKAIPQPQIAAAEPKPIPRVVTPEVAPAPAIRPQVHTGLFGSEEAAKKTELAKQLKVGGFGDPNGVKTSPDQKNPTLLAKVGAFELPEGDGAAGGRGGQGRGMIRQTSFGSADAAGSGSGGNGLGAGRGTVRQAGFGSNDGGNGNGTGGNGRGGTVKTGGFGETVPAAQSVQRARPAAPTTTPVEILAKPKPIYTAEARSLHIEGEVAIDVVFSATGQVQVLRVIQGLGHGLDEAAQQAASQIRFRPGTRDGVPVDTHATIRIVFELT